MNSVDFYYNGQRSVDLGIYLVKLNTDFTKSPFLADKEIIEESVAGNDRPYYFGTSRKPLSLKMTLSCAEGQWTYEKRRELARWLNTDTYALFYSTDNPNKWYYCQYVGGIDLDVNYVLQGYIEVEMRCDGAYAYSPTYDKGYIFPTANPTIISFENAGDMDLHPEMWIEKIDDGDIEIKNLSFANTPSFKFTGLLNAENVYIDNESEVIETDITGKYRYSNFNDNYLSLKRGMNRLQVTGKCKITFKWQYRILG